MQGDPRRFAEIWSFKKGILFSVLNVSNKLRMHESLDMGNRKQPEELTENKLFIL